MRPGVIGTVLLVLGGGAAGGLLYAKDAQRLEAAREGCDRGVALLAKGDAKAARESFETSVLAASHVSGVTFMRPEALKLAKTALSGLATLRALDRVESDPLSALRELQAEGGPPQATEILKRMQAELLVDAGLALEGQGAVAQAETVYRLAAEETQEVGSARLAEAQLGARRVAVLKNLGDAEVALAAGREQEAAQLAEAARGQLQGAENPFDEAERAAALGRRLGAILGEVESNRLLEVYAKQLEALSQAVLSEELGRLLPRVEGTQAPSLPGEHPRAAEHTKRLQQLAARHTKIRKVAQTFAGMVLARKSGGGALFLDETEVTNAAYARFVADGGYTKPELWSREGKRRLSRFKDRSSKPGPRTWLGGAPPKEADQQPVAGISYFEAEAYARWSGKRLPTWAEWKAVASRGSKYPWGDLWEPGRANVKGAGKGPKAVGSFPKGAGPTGAQDVIGNVREIVRLAGGKYAAAGGSFLALPEKSTVSSAVTLSPSLRASDTGFRCAKELKWDG